MGGQLYVSFKIFNDILSLYKEVNKNIIYVIFSSSKRTYAVSWLPPTNDHITI
jgi:hypothetical protein